MALQIITERPHGQSYFSDRRLFLTETGEVVEDGDPRAHSLLVCKGGALPYADALKYGLLPSRSDMQEPAETGIEEKSIPAAPENKMITGPPEDKSIKRKETKHAKNFYPHGNE